MENAALRLTDDESEDQNGERFSQDVAASQHPSWRPASQCYFLSASKGCFLSHSCACAIVEPTLNRAACDRGLSVSSAWEAETLLSWHQGNATGVFIVIVSGPVRAVLSSTLRDVPFEEESQARVAKAWCTEGVHTSSSRPKCIN